MRVSARTADRVIVRRVSKPMEAPLSLRERGQLRVRSTTRAIPQWPRHSPVTGLALFVVFVCRGQLSELSVQCSRIVGSQRRGSVVAEDMPYRNEDSDRTPGWTPDLPQVGSSTIDMTEFEAMLSTGTGAALGVRVGAVADLPEQATVEWAITWADGRLTHVNGEAEARLVAARCPTCAVACRIVGDWGLA
jgi:hypothetical protein